MLVLTSSTETKGLSKPMKKIIYRAISPIVLSFLVSGCMTATRFQIENGTGGDVTVKSYHTHKLISIPAWGRGNLFHTNGDISIFSGESGFLYKNMSPIQFRNTKWLDNNHSLLKPILTVRLYFNKDGCLYIVPKQRSFNNTQDAQPKGYPVQPIEFTSGSVEGL